MIHHIAMRTRDVDRLVAFYREWFGLREVRSARPRSVWLGLGEGVLMIELANEGEPAIVEGSLDLIAFKVTVEERRALRERLTIEAETEHTLYFRDPDGRRVAVSSYPL